MHLLRTPQIALFVTLMQAVVFVKQVCACSPLLV
jgi:hypothetical protein